MLEDFINNCICIFKQSIDRIATMNGLKKQYLRDHFSDVNMNSLSGINELALIINVIDFDARGAAGYMGKLKRLYFMYVTSKTVQTLIDHSLTLKAIKIKELDSNRFDSTALNKARAKINGAIKVSIYLFDHEMIWN